MPDTLMLNTSILGILILLSALAAAIEFRVRRARANKARMADAEAYFKKYDGHTFHMGREEPEHYASYVKLKIPPDVTERWRQELIQETFDRFFDQPDRVWCVHGGVLEILRNTKTQLEENCARLLSLMERMDDLDVRQKMLIIESMPGRTRTQTDGGCYLFCTRTTLGERMNAVMQRLIESALNDPDRGELEERLLKAVSAYESAYQRFHNQERHSSFAD